MWSKLPHDILALICKPLTIPDIFSFASVCHSWRSAAALKDQKQHFHRFDAQKPWLVFSGSENTVANFYSVSDNRFFAIPDQPADLSPINTYFVLGADHGWIIAADERSELLLLNPITRQQIDLPPVSTFDHPHIHGLIEENSLEELRYCLYFKACLSSSPSINGNYVVVVLLDTSDSFAIAKSGDKKWTIIHDELLKGSDMVFYHNNDVSIVYFTDFRGMIRYCDLNSNQSELTMLFPGRDWATYYNNFYLVHSPWGDLLYVRRARDANENFYRTIKFEVYKIDLKSQTLLKVENLGQYALFVGGSNPVCILVEDTLFLKKNCVYFTDEQLDFSLQAKDSQRDIGFYNLENGSIESILPDDPRLFWPPPVWFTPSLA